MSRDATSEDVEWKEQLWLGPAESIVLLGGAEDPDEYLLLAHRDASRVAIGLTREQVEMLGKFFSNVDAFNAMDKALNGD